MSTGIAFPRTLYKGHEKGTLEMVFHGTIHRYDSLLVDDMEELEAGEEMGYIDSYHDAIFGIEPEPYEKLAEDPVPEPKTGEDKSKSKEEKSLDQGAPDQEASDEKSEESNSDKESEPETDEEF